MENQNKEIIEFTMEEMIINPIFIKHIESKIFELKEKRNARENPPSGQRYIIDWFDRMENQNLLNCETFVEQIPKIWSKKSNLNSESRIVILEICNEAVLKTIEQMELENQTKIKSNGSTIKKPNKRTNK